MQFVGIRSEGGLLPFDILEQIAEEKLEGQKASAFGLSPGRRLTDEIARAWSDAQAYWKVFTGRWDDLPEKDSFGTTLTRERWVTRLLQDLLGYELTYQPSAAIVNSRNYAISHRAGSGAQAPPVHIEGFKIDLDKRPESRRLSPQALLQEYLNNSEDHLWGIVTNGIQLRLLRDTSRTSRPTYLEFNLESILEGNNFNEFALFYRLCHRTRLPKEGEDASKCLLEKYFQTGIEQGGRVRDHLRDGVEEALKLLGSGFLQHPQNRDLMERAKSGRLTPQEYHRQLLRLVYRLLFLMVAEERRLILPDEPESQRRWRIYSQNYSVHRLRLLAESHVEKTNFADLWIGLKKTFQLFQDGDSNPLGIPPLNGDLFSSTTMRDLDGTHLANDCLLEAMRNLSIFRDGRNLQRINYSALDVEELGSVYESLLDFQPVFVEEEAGLKFDLRTGSERKSTGSYYTRPELVRELIESALVPVMEDRLKEAKRGGKPGGSPRVQAGDKGIPKDGALAPEAAAQVEAILSMNVCDPACGSGHFLLAAARRLGRELAKIKTGEEEPTPREFHLAVREVISHCIYGVDLNPLAVDLCKLALWLEGHWTGKPLSFLDHRIKCGNSLIGVLDPKVLAEGIPDGAYTAVTGDVKPVASAFKKRNREERKQWERYKNQGRFRFDVEDDLHTLAAAAREVSSISEDSPADVRRKAQRYGETREGGNFNRDLNASHLWTAAFFAELKDEADQRVPTNEELRRCLETLPVNGRTLNYVFDTAKQFGFFHWRLEFPDIFEQGGFSVILGNPPWERIKLQEEEHWIDDPYIARARNKAERERRIREYRTSTDTNKIARIARFDSAKHHAEAETRFIRQSSRFPLTAVGDVNTYALFTEMVRQLTRAGGRAGILVPTGIATDDTTKQFFSDAVSAKALVSLIGFENEAFIFPSVHHAFKFCELTLGSPGASASADLVFLCRYFEDIHKHEKHFRLSPEDFRLLNPNTHTCPVFRTGVDAEITKKLYRKFPVLLNESHGLDPWGTRFLTMFHMANDSSLFSTNASSDLLPLYEAKMIHQFDHRYATYEGATQANLNAGILPQTKEQQKSDPKFEVQPRYWVPPEEVEERLGNWKHSWLLGFRDVTSAVVERTAIFSLLPRVGVGHKIPLLFLEAARSSKHIASFLGNVNSLVFDYITRQKIGGNSLSYFILKQLPVIAPDGYREADVEYLTARVLDLIYTSDDMATFALECGLRASPFTWSEPRRGQLRAELDAYYAHLYGLTRDELRYILNPKDIFGEDFPSETFRVLKEREEKEFGEYRTRRLVLEAFDKLAESPRFKDEMPKRVSAFEVPKKAASAS